MDIMGSLRQYTKGAIIAITVFLISVILIIISNNSYADDGSKPTDGRLVTIYDRGTEKAIVTQAETVGDVLKEADVMINDKDLVEPSVNEKLVASNYKVNVYRSRPVMVVDGNMRIKITTAFQTAKQIVESAGIELFDEDVAILERNDDIISDGVGLILKIKRSTPFSLTLFGNTSEVRTQAKTIKEMLDEKNIKLDDNDKILPSEQVSITQGMTVKIWREGKQTINIEEQIDFDINKIENGDMPVSYKQIQTPGEKGLRNVTYEIIIQDGKEVSRKEIASLTIKQPSKQVEVVGIRGKYSTPTENQVIVWNALINSGFNEVQSAGIMGNLMQEHGFKTSDTAGGLGIAQWTSGRRNDLINRYPDSYTNIYSQVEYLLSELNGRYAGVRDAIKSSNSLVESVQIFQNSFERCGDCRESQRIIFAYDIYATFVSS